MAVTLSWVVLVNEQSIQASVSQMLAPNKHLIFQCGDWFIVYKPQSWILGESCYFSAMD